MRPKHVVKRGRYRVVWRFGHYRVGFHRKWGGAWTAALPFVWVSVVRYPKRRRDPMDEHTQLWAAEIRGEADK